MHSSHRTCGFFDIGTNDACGRRMVTCVREPHRPREHGQAGACVDRQQTGRSTTPAWSGRSWVAAVVGVVAVGAVLRVLHVLVVLEDVPAGLDSVTYQLLGGSIRNGTGYVSPTSLFTGEYVPTAAFPPGYPAYQALWQSVLDSTLTSVRLAGIIPAAVTITLTAYLGRRLVGPRVGLAAAALVAAHPGLIAADGSAMSETLAVPLVVAAQLLALRLYDSDGGRLALAVALGPLLGAAILTRQDLALVGGILVVWLVVAMPSSWRAKVTVGAVVAVGAALVVAPWVVRNAVAVDVAAVSTLSPTGAVAGANCPSTYDGPDLGSWTIACLTAARSGRLSESEATARGISERELADTYRSSASAYVRDNLDRLPLVVAAREARAWSIWDPRDLARRDAYESRSYGFQVRARPLEAAFAIVGAGWTRGARPTAGPPGGRGGGPGAGRRRQRGRELRQSPLQRDRPTQPGHRGRRAGLEGSLTGTPATRRAR